MRFSILTSLTAILLASNASAQTDSGAAIATRISKDWSAYEASITANPSYKSLVSAIESYLSTPVAGFTETVTDWSAFVANPTPYMTRVPTAWESVLPTSLRNEYNAAITSQVNALASIAKKDISGAERVVSNGGGIAGIVAVAGVAVGAVAFVL